MTLYEGYEFYKSIQGTKYDKNDLVVKEKLQEFRNNFGKFTDEIFQNKHFLVPFEKGMWQNSGNFTKYMWNRYKLEKDNTNLVIYFNASTDEGLFVGIGLIDDKLNDFEKLNLKNIYNFLENECKSIKHKDFDSSFNTRKFIVKDTNNFEKIDYDYIIRELKKVYLKTIEKIYKDSNENIKKQGIYMKQPLNQILFGPPGTGKTFNTINKAIEIIENRVLTKEELEPKNRTVLKDKFEHNLFNTYRSYIDYKTHFPVKFTQHTDPRGAFVEVIRLGIGGQCSFSTTVPDITRGNHYHTRKIERFAVIKGKALIQLRKIDTDEVLDFYLDGTEPAYVDMPIWYTHNIKNIGAEDLYTIFWIDEPFNPEDADTYFESV